MEPCSKATVIDRLQERSDLNNDRLTEIEKRQIIIGNTVDNINAIVSNGLSHKVNEMHQKLTADVVPVVSDYSSLKKRLEDLLWWAIKGTLAGVCAGGISLIVWNIAQGWRP